MFALVCVRKGKAFSSNNTTKLCYLYFQVEQVKNYFKFGYLFLPIELLQPGQKNRN